MRNLRRRCGTPVSGALFDTHDSLSRDSGEERGCVLEDIRKHRQPDKPIDREKAFGVLTLEIR